jgi:TetR/AcrR family transcriptional regulator, regulator of cefoperazone and chloramphenicol sensitivity
MTSPIRKSGQRTPDRLLNSAIEVFAEKGYRDATIADICERAKANVAAVNYYFRDKESLYQQAWRTAFHRSMDAHPPDGGVAPDAPAEERLGGMIRAHMVRIDDPACHEFEIVHKEIANPTGLLSEMMRECIEPMREEFDRVIAEALGLEATDRNVVLCRMSIMGQCMHTMIRERRHREMEDADKLPTPPHPRFPISVFTEHVVRFSLAAMREMRREIAGGTFPAEE